MKNERLYLRINAGLKEELETLAKEDNRTLSNLIETILINYIKEKEIDRMNNIINKLQTELLNKEITLTEMDRTVLENINYKTEDVFENINLALENSSWSYQNIENLEDVEGINVVWELVEKNEDNFKTIVKIKEIERL